VAAYYCGRFILVVVCGDINYFDADQKELVILQKVVLCLPAADVGASLLQLHL